MICTLFITCAFFLTAHAERMREDGWFADIQIGSGIVDSQPPGLEVFGDTGKRKHPGDEGFDLSKGIPLIEGKIGDDFQSAATVGSLGDGTEEPPWRAAIGQRMAGWGLDAHPVFYKKHEVGEAPSLSGKQSDHAGSELFGCRVDWDDVLNTGIRIFTKRMEIEIDHDRIGDIVPDLRRDGTDSIFGIRYPWNLGSGGVLNGGISYILIDRKGVADSGHGYAGELNHMLEWGRLSFATGLELAAREFGKIDPAYTKKREETTFTLSETVSFAEPFGIDNAYLFGIAAFTKTVGDIGSFEGDTFILGAGVGCRF